ncbi:hypothetical protein ABIB59_001717 [Citrobacter sp. UYEF32]
MNGGYPGGKIKFYLLYVIYLFNIVNGLLFSIKNYIRKYIEVFELNVFPFLIMKYGVVVNLIYIFPLVMSMAAFIILIYFTKKQSCLLLK